MPQNTHGLVLANVDALEGFEAHLRALTRVEDVEITECNFLPSPSVVGCLAPMRSNLIRLEISDSSESTSRTITSLLAGLPQLRSFATEEFRVTGDTGGVNLTSRIPFFEGNNSAALYSYKDQQGLSGPPDWTPPSVRFGDLEINTTYILQKAVLVNQWLSESCTTLASLAIRGGTGGKY